MKKNLLIVPAAALILLSACGQTSEGVTTATDIASVDESVSETESETSFTADEIIEITGDTGTNADEQEIDHPDISADKSTGGAAGDPGSDTYSDSSASDSGNAETTALDDEPEDDGMNEDVPAGGNVVTSGNNESTFCYQPEQDGMYSFTQRGEDYAPWDLYILDEKFPDAIRYLFSNYESNARTDCTVELKAGQYVYCICSVNDWNASELADSVIEIEYIGDGSDGKADDQVDIFDYPDDDELISDENVAD